MSVEPQPQAAEPNRRRQSEVNNWVSECHLVRLAAGGSPSPVWACWQRPQQPQPATAKPGFGCCNHQHLQRAEVCLVIKHVVKQRHLSAASLLKSAAELHMQITCKSAGWDGSVLMFTLLAVTHEFIAARYHSTHHLSQHAQKPSEQTRSGPWLGRFAHQAGAHWGQCRLPASSAGLRGHAVLSAGCSVPVAQLTAPLTELPAARQTFLRVSAHLPGLTIFA